MENLTVLSLAKGQETSTRDLVLSWLPWAILLVCSYIPTRFFLDSRRPRKAVEQPIESKPKEKPTGAEQKPGTLPALRHQGHSLSDRL